MIRFSPGDIIEVEIQNGLTYLQVISLHPSYPEVIRHIEGVYHSRPPDLKIMTAHQSRILGMVPIANLIESGSIVGSKVGTANIPQNCRAFPTFQMPIRNKQGQIVYWWFWDGDGIWYDSSPNAVKNQDFPVREVMTANMLIERLG